MTKAPLSQHYTHAGYLATLHHNHTRIKTSSTMSDEEPFAEVDPTGRFGRYHDILGSGSTKKVYRAFDLIEGMEVVWNQIKIRCFSDDRRAIDRLYTEIGLLLELQHDNVIRLFDVWKDEENDTVNFITEFCDSGSLRQYRKKYKHVALSAIKKWSREILRGLDYLHRHEPCIIHRDLNCANVFISGNHGEVKLGDFGLAAVVDESHSAHTVLGTPEFMAPEIYDEEYTEKVDIYSFGLCLLELVTLEIPYLECDSFVEIYRAVSMGVRPKAMEKVKDSEVRAFIEKCLVHAKVRPSAAELLEDPFFAGIDEEDAANININTDNVDFLKRL